MNYICNECLETKEGKAWISIQDKDKIIRNCSYLCYKRHLDHIPKKHLHLILNIEDLQKGFAYAGSTAMMTGISFEQLFSLMATLSNRALEAGISSRSLNKMFIDMLEHTDELNQFISSMGMTFEIIKDGKLDIDANWCFLRPSFNS